MVLAAPNQKYILINSQIILCLFGAFLLFLMWNHIRKRNKSSQKDLGLLLFAITILSYGLGLYLKYILDNEPKDKDIHYISTINNGFLLSTLPYFEFTFKKIKKKIKILHKPFKWPLTIIIWSIIIIFILTIISDIGIVRHIDFVYSSIVFILIGYSISVTLSKSGYGEIFKLIGGIFTLCLIFSQYISIIIEKSLRTDWQYIWVFCVNIAFIYLLLILGQSWEVREVLKNKKTELKDDPVQLQDNPIQLKDDLVRSKNNPQVSLSKRSKVFICYSHNDEEWLNRVLLHLKYLEKKGIIDVWVDRRIKAGQNWKKEINKALDSSKVAILLISQNFLASDFIIDNELPLLLAAANNDEAKIIQLVLKPCSINTYRELLKFQMINEPKNPMIKLNEFEQEELLVKLAKAVKQALEE